MFALLFKANICDSLSPKGKRVLACRCPYLLVPEVLLLCYWIRLKTFALTLLKKKKKLNSNIAKAVKCASGFSHDHPISCSCSQPIILLIHQFLNQHQHHLLWWVWRDHFSMPDQHLGTAWQTEHLVLHCISYRTEGIHPYFETIHVQSLIYVPITFA